jgi:hypothetical protein
MMGWDRMLRKDNNKMGNRETDGEKEEKHIERDRDKYTENERGRERVGIKDENTSQSTLQNTAQRNPPILYSTLDFLISMRTGTPSSLKSCWSLDRRNLNKWGEKLEKYIRVVNIMFSTTG